MPSAVGDRLARIGVLGLQGDFREHLDTFERLGAAAIDVRRPDQLDDIDALVIPGGESTTIGKLAQQYGFIPKLKQRVAEGMAVWGTCAGAIFIARDVPGHPHPLAGLMDIRVRRNAFGRQIDSFESDLTVPAIGGGPFPAVFIRAPLIESVGANVEVLATLDDTGAGVAERAATIVAARQGKLLATSFHPELTHDDRFHEYFLSFVGGSRRAGEARARRT